MVQVLFERRIWKQLLSSDVVQKVRSYACFLKHASHFLDEVDIKQGAIVQDAAAQKAKYRAVAAQKTRKLGP